MNKHSSWEECTQNNTALKISPDNAKANSLIDIAKERTQFLSKSKKIPNYPRPKERGFTIRNVRLKSRSEERGFEPKRLLSKKAIGQCEEIVFSTNDYKIPPELVEEK
ncbi:MAG: hypothetical protein O2779_03985 [Nanoarchaeota archaeon]|nr:hypothetical protein [Nanoarchaeota archaeon]